MTNSVLGVRNIQHTNGTDAMAIDTSGKVTFSNTVTGNIIEKICGLCDGSTRTTKSGNTFTLPNVSAVQTINGTSYVDVDGSTVTYTAPTDCIGVMYEFLHNAAWNGDTAHAIQHYKLYLDGTEVVYGRRTHAATYMESKPMLQWYFRINSSLSSQDGNTGAIPSWTSSKTMKWSSRAYAGNDVARQHGSQYWDGGGGNQFHMPQIWITAFGASS